MGALSWQHLLIVLLIVLVLFGGSRLAGLGKSTGRALREFKEETKGLRDKDEPERTTPSVDSGTTHQVSDTSRVVEPRDQEPRVQDPQQTPRDS
jgi:sec-independent protein translocase protein TatA